MAKAPGRDIRERFGLAVKAGREALGLTQEELADRAGIHRTYLSDVERGSRNVSLLNIERLASALDLEASDLLRRAERP
jgi:transcriptional regulator with XRE-family HTH domain